MLQSMTGFGRAKTETERYTLHAEVKTLNSKGADISLRLPRRFSDKELEIRNRITHVLDRGKISVSIEFEAVTQTVEAKSKFNTDLLKHYFTQLKNAVSEIGHPIDDSTLFTQALRMHGVVEDARETEEENTEADIANLVQCVEEALEECRKFRIDEGKVLQETLKVYILEINSLLGKVKEQDPHRIEVVRTRIKSHLNELEASESFDANRFEQEMIFYIEKFDISEEKVRLANHLDYFLTTMEKDDLSGRKLGFIGQEIGREINTIGSKANDAVIQKLVVEMKDLLEKIKEQSLNVL